MTRLAPDLFQRRFDDLMAIGRARLPAVAPEWTDHNAHDPGITLMELLAWVGEAQLFALSRTRQDEREGYARLLGVRPSGTTAARGLLWTDPSDPSAPAATHHRRVVIPGDAVIHVLNADEPTFHPSHKLLWVPGRLVALTSRGRGGRILNLTTVNARGGTEYLPFGERAGPGDVLTLEFECRDDAGLFGGTLPRAELHGALWSIGVRVAPAVDATGGLRPIDATGRSRVSATIDTRTARIPLPVVADTTDGFLRTGALLLDLGPVTESPRRFTIEVRSRSGFPRPPRVLRIEPNVVPIVQGKAIEQERHETTGEPDWSFDLGTPGLCFTADQEPVQVEIAEAAGLTSWQRVPRLADTGPRDRAFEIDPGTGTLTFGNGVNGRIPPAGADVLVSYAVSDAESGNVAPNHRWHVAGFAGSFGVNLDPIAGGASPPRGRTEQRREARQRARETHALVSSADLVAAATAVPLLEVVRAWVVPLGTNAPRTGAVTLAAMRSRPAGVEPDAPPETRRWLEAIRRQLAGRMPLGVRLAVAAPVYVGFSIHGTISTLPGRDPRAVEEKVLATLRRRLSLVPFPAGAPARRVGVPVTRRDVEAWLRSIDGVGRDVSLRLRQADGSYTDEIRVPPGGLPRWNASVSKIAVIGVQEVASP